MIAVSSFRPYGQHPEYDANQLRAHNSWLPHFARIIYFNSAEPTVTDAKVVFVGNNERPTIKAMVGQCMRHSGWSCIINSDIVLHPRFLNLERHLDGANALCAISRRYTIFNGNTVQYMNFPILEGNDLGLDIFIAKQSVWAHVYQLIPLEFKIGMIVWDQWVSNCFCKDFRPYCYDLTPAKLIFHPKHGGRPSIEFQPPRDKYLTFSSWPRLRLSF